VKENERLVEQIRNFVRNHNKSPYAEVFSNRLDENSELTRDKSPKTHFCVYFAAYDSKVQEVFVGHHKKSNLWLFNGGHIDEGETPQEALMREVDEEWGVEVDVEKIGDPKLLTITEIDNPEKQTCTRHYDIWYFVPISKYEFTPVEELLEKVTDPSTLEAISKFEEIFSSVNEK